MRLDKRSIGFEGRNYEVRPIGLKLHGASVTFEERCIGRAAEPGDSRIMRIRGRQRWAR